MTEKIYNQDKSSKQQAVHWYKEYLFGLLINLTVVQTLKIYVGEPRPHFFEACNPKEASTCTGTEYVSSYTCTKGHWLNQADTSFPSGHTSLAIHASFFLVVSFDSKYVISLPKLFYMFYFIIIFFLFIFSAIMIMFTKNYVVVQH
ncbi:unnamed protein product [Diatraea saccharalis]|uniref:Phosphatidic acid phosphatase type 2/haloperoxidase domain-containing protein n=1 Tax=Diatraea saccharalis TaxID=40085 RepID=A0A9P0G419_9NEOP|nr:unnamed protein product [Diatraea saccharalis]